jgi:hypothetical protein
MKQLLPHLGWVLGLLFLVISAFVFPSPPYQDPTPEMRTLEASQIQLSERLAVAGLIFVASGALWLFARSLFRRFSRTTIT